MASSADNDEEEEWKRGMAWREKLQHSLIRELPDQRSVLAHKVAAIKNPHTPKTLYLPYISFRS